MKLTYADVKAAADRIAGRVRPVTLAPAADDPAPGAGAGRLWFALEFLQHTGTFKARGAQNFIQAHKDDGTLPSAGVTIASGGNAGLACAWAARAQGVTATVYLPATAPAVKVERLRGYGARVRLVGTEYAGALAACHEFADSSGALRSHAYDNPYIAAGAGTLMSEIHQRLPRLDTIVVAAGGGGLFTGIATAAHHYDVRTVVVEPEHCRSLNAAIEAGQVVDSPVDSIAADALGARRVSTMALTAAQTYDVTSLLVPDAEIIAARRTLWQDHRLAVEYAAATALAALTTTDTRPGRGYRPAPGEQVCVVLCGANTDPADLTG